MTRSIVTGGAGFLGSHMCDYLLEKGHKVVAIDNLCTGNKANISHIKNKHFTFIKADISKPFKVTGSVDFFFNMASPASPDHYLALPIETLKVGSLGIINSLEVARQKKSIFLQASTSEVYGDPIEHPQKETYWGNVNSIGPRSVYDESKRFAEAMVMAYHRKFKVDTKLVRIFNTYGPRMRLDDGRAVPNFLSQALKNKDITIYGDGSQTRSFCYVSDLLEGIFLLANSNYHEPVNIGNPIELTINEMAKLIVSKTNSRSKLVFKPLPTDDPKVRRPDISLAKRILKWEPKIALNDGLDETISYFTSKS